MEQSLHFFFLFTLVGRYSFQLWDERVERIVLVTCLQEEWYKCWRFIKKKKKSKHTHYAIKWLGNLCLFCTVYRLFTDIALTFKVQEVALIVKSEFQSMGFGTGSLCQGCQLDRW